jgi:ABC-2 type transport system ATP-binding protein
LGLLLPTRGSAKIFGKDVVRDSLSIREEIGYIPGDVRLYPKMTGGYFINYFSRFKPLKAPRLKAELVERFDLDLGRKIKEYSRGNKQKLAIIAALIHDPHLLILDEPTLGLDPMMQREFYQVLREFKSRGATVFLSSHFLPEVERICERVAVIGNGQLKEVETIEEIVGKKIHELEVKFAEKVEPDFFDFSGVSSLERHNDLIYHFSYKGDIDNLIKRLSKAKVADINLTHASLEEVFFEFYEKPKESQVES